MPSESELEKLAITLVGRANHYLTTLDKVVEQTELAAKEMDKAIEKMAVDQKANLKKVSAAQGQTVASTEALSAAQKRTALAAKAAAAAQRKQTEAVRAGKRMMEAHRTPLEMYKRKHGEINILHRRGAISAQTHQRAIKALNLEYQRGVHSMMRFANSMDTVGSKMKMQGMLMSFGITLPVVGLAAASIKAASDAEETQSKFDVVFSSIKDSAEGAAADLDKSYGLSSTGAKTLLSDTGDLLTGFGFTQESALDLSTQVQKLAVDLASFTNVEGGAERASKALTKAMLGEREMVKTLGIAILEEDVKAQMLKQAKEGLTFESERQAKAYATLQLALEQSKNAIGDYARTQDSLANQTRELMADFREFRVELGKELLPVAKQLVAWMREALKWWKALEAPTKKYILIAVGLTAVLGPLLIVLGFMASAIASMITLMTALAVATGVAVLPLLGFLAIAVVITAAVVILTYQIYKFFASFADGHGILQNIKFVLMGIAEGAKNAAIAIAEMLRPMALLLPVIGFLLGGPAGAIAGAAIAGLVLATTKAPQAAAAAAPSPRVAQPVPVVFSRGGDGRVDPNTGKPWMGTEQRLDRLIRTIERQPTLIGA